MGDQQCGLCLSCGAPFMPDIGEIDFFNRQGNLSVVFLNTEFKRNPEIMRRFERPRFATGKHGAHVFHKSHHATAIKYMCERYDSNANTPVGWGSGPARAVGYQVADAQNEPMLFFHAPTSKEAKKARLAVWDAPPAAERLNMKPLWNRIIHASQAATARPVLQNLEETFITCVDCNTLMTQEADFKYLVGFGPAARRNTHGRIIQGQPVRQYPVNENGHSLENGYGHWTVGNYAANVPARPRQDQDDSEAPHIAYYLHQCLPIPNAANQDPFENRIADPAMRSSARTLFIELCWIILEIAGLATIVEEGKVTAPGTKLSNGIHQHYGALDFYVSFFLWRLLEFQFGQRVSLSGLDFVQWHQKYFWDAMNCRALFRPNERKILLGQRMYGGTAQAPRLLVEQICGRLVQHYKVRLRPLIAHVTGMGQVVPEVTQFFLPLEIVRVLRERSTQVCVLVRLVLYSCNSLCFADGRGGLPVGLGQVRHQRAPLQDHPPVPKLPRQFPAPAARFPGQLAVAGDRARAGGQQRPPAPRGVPALPPLLPPGLARSHARQQGGSGHASPQP